MDKAIVALLTTADNIVLLMLFYNLFLVPKRRRKSDYLLFVIFSFICTLIYVYSESIPLLTTLLIDFSILYFFQGTKGLKLFVLALFLQVGILADFINSLLSVEIGSIGLFGVSDVLVAVLLPLNIWRRGKPKLIKKIGAKHLLLWLLTITNFSGLAALFFNGETNSSFAIVFGVLLVFSTLLVYYFSFYLEKYYRVREENMLATKQLEFQKEKFEQMSSYLKMSRKVIHDIRKHYDFINEALENNRNEEVKAYVKEISENLTFPDLLGFTGNDSVDSMLYSLYTKCQKEGIQLENQIVINHTIPINERLLASLLGNLFDRAIARIKQNKSEKLVLSMKTSAQFLLIELQYAEKKKSTAKNMMMSDEKLMSILQTIEKLSGVYETDSSNGVCRIKVMLPLQDNAMAGE